MESTNLQRISQGAPLERITFTEEQVELIRLQIAPNAKPQELALFLYQAQRTGLDPMARQIYCIHRGGKMTIQVSIDGFRVVAERSNDYAGQDAPEYMEQDGKLIACRVTVYRFRGNNRYPAAVGVAYMSEYNAGGPMWQRMPRTMLAKCAEAQALRKAYPQDLSGLYTTEEMQQADRQEAPAEWQPATTVQEAAANAAGAPDDEDAILRGKQIVETAIALLNTCNSLEEIEGMEDHNGGGDWINRSPTYRTAKAERLAFIESTTTH